MLQRPERQKLSYISPVNAAHTEILGTHTGFQGAQSDFVVPSPEISLRSTDTNLIGTQLTLAVNRFNAYKRHQLTKIGTD